MALTKLRFIDPSRSPIAAFPVQPVTSSGIVGATLHTSDAGVLELTGEDDGSIRFILPDGLTRRWAPGQSTDVVVTARKPLVRLLMRLVDPRGRPAAGVGVVLHEKVSSTTLAFATSDTNGVLALAFEPVAPPADGEHGVAAAKKVFQLRVSVNKNPIDASAIVGLPAGMHGPTTVVVERPVTAAEAAGVATATAIGDSEADLLEAVRRAPELAKPLLPARQPSACHPESSLEFPARVYNFQQVGLLPYDQEVGEGRLGTHNRAPQVRPRTVRPAVVVEYRQEWWEYGYALGDLLYSVPLAPCEQVKLATLDWRRRDWAQKSTALDESHFQDTTVSRNQSVDESVHMVSAKGVASLTTGGGGALSLGVVNFGGGQQLQASGELVDATTSGSRTINDRVQQASATLRSTRSFTVTEVTQNEQASVTTRVVRNHNHSHTLTFQYFEVLQRFRIRTRATRIRPALLVSFPLIEFNQAVLLQHGYLLRRALLDPTLAPFLDSFLAMDSAAPEAGDAEAGGSEATISGKLASIVVTGAATGLTDHELIVNGTRYFMRASMNSVTTLPDGRTRAVFTAAAVNVTNIADVAKVGLIATGPTGVGRGTPSPIVIDDLEIAAQDAAGAMHVLMRRDQVTLDPGERVVQYVGAQPPASASSTRRAQPPATPSLTRLLAHLNAYRWYYSAAVHAGGDAGARWSALAATPLDRGAAVDAVENIVIGSVAEYLAFPVVAPELLPESWRIGNVGDLAGRADERVVSLPTAGVFAEAQLGQCNASEVIDNTRFWQWHLAPCPDEAPAITEGMLGSRYQSPATLIQPVQSTLVPSPIQIPDLPKPMIEIGDATLAELVKGLDLPDAKAVMDLVKGLSDTSAEGFSKIVDTLGKFASKAGMAAAGISDASAVVGALSGAEGLGGAAGAAGAAEGAAVLAGALIPTAMLAL